MPVALDKVFFSVIIFLTAAERLGELFLSRRHAKEAFARGGREFGQEHYPWMVALHTAILVGALVECWTSERLIPAAASWFFLSIYLICQACRWWIIALLGKRWNTRVIVFPGQQLEKSGPYRFLSHPNYLIVLIESLALPMIQGAWVTALLGVAGNVLILKIRIKVEEEALHVFATHG